MKFETVNDIMIYIRQQYDLEPTVFKDNHLEYDRVVISKNTESVLEQNNAGDDMWTIDRKGHSLDYCRTEELFTQIGPGGGLVYFMFPKERSMDAI